MRPSPLLLLTVLLIGCGDPPATPPPTVTPLAPRDPFSLGIDAPGVPGQPAPIRIEGDAAGVTVWIRRADAPIELFESWFVPVSPLTPPPRWEEGITVELDGKTEPVWPRLPAGLHLVTAIRGNERKMGLLPITDLDLIIRRSDDEVLVFVVDSQTGAAMPGARVSILGPQERRTGRADAGGVFRAAVRPGPEMQVIAFSGQRIGVGGSSRVLGRRDDDLSILRLDRDRCAPGSDVAFAGVLRVRAAGRIRPYSTDDGRYRIRGFGGRVLTEGAVELGPAGTFSEVFYVPKRVGDGSITLEVEFGEHLLTRELRVRRPFPAPFTVEVHGDPKEPELGSRFHFRIRALLADRTPLPGVAAKYSVSRGGRAVLSGEGILSETGELGSSVMLEGKGEYEITAEVTGADQVARSGTLQFGVRTHAVGMRLVPQSRLLDPGEAAVIGVLLAGAGPVTGTLKVDGKRHPFRVAAGERETVVRFQPTMPGRIPIRATARDGSGRELRATEELWVLDDLAFVGLDEITLVADRDEVRAGDSVRLLLLLPPGLANCGILETVEGRSLGAHRAGTRRSLRNLLRLAAPRGQGGEVQIRVWASRGGALHTAEASLRVRESAESLVVTGIEGPAGRGVAVRVTDEGGRRFPSMVLFSTPGQPGALSPWLRTDPEGRTETWKPPSPGATTVQVLAVGLDGRVARQTLRTDGGSGTAEAMPSAPEERWEVSKPVETLEVALQPGEAEHWIVLPEGLDLSTLTCRIDLNATPRSKLFHALPGLEILPAGSTLRDLVPLLRLAAAEAFVEAGLEVPAELTGDPDAARRALADLLYLRNEDGAWGHFPGDAPDPRMTDLVVATINATGLLEEELPRAEPPMPRPEVDAPTALDLAERCYDLLPEIPMGPSTEAGETLVRVRVNDVIVGTARLLPGTPEREYRFLLIPSRYFRPGSNRLQFSVAGPPGVRATVALASRQDTPPRRSKLAITRSFSPAGPARRGSRVTARLTISAKSPLQRVHVRCPLPAGAGLATWPVLPAGVTFEERAGAVDLFLPVLAGTLTLDLPLVVLRAGTFEVAPARAVLLEQPDRWAQSKGATLLFR